MGNIYHDTGYFIFLCVFFIGLFMLHHIIEIVRSHHE